MTLIEQFLLGSFILAGATAGHAADIPPAAEKGPLRAALAESCEGNRGVVRHFRGSTVAMVVTAVNGTYVTGRGQAVTQSLVRLDRIDGISAAL
ncbi:hypothetical protein [Polaromonas sp.]|uniref:hypothetical protein n=1 Tax=Polaromonas sp. TaxID=1869339 RepID=UPI00326742B2